MVLGISKKKLCYTEEIINILRLMRSENVGIKTFFSLIRMYGNATSAIQNIDIYTSKSSKKIKLAEIDDIAKELSMLERAGAKLVSYLDPEYPRLLKQIDDFPPILTYKGDISLVNNDCIAIVGSRNASVNGKIFASNIAKQIIENNIIVVSGLARGIDTAAHIASCPRTIAVLAGGIDHVYPAENLDLFNKIADNGLVITESRIGSEPTGRHFPMRNRIISGISMGTVVVEASLKSGSLITAKFAIEHNREVFAVPGFPLDPRCRGTNSLIKDGAHLLESFDDILQQLPSLRKASNNDAIATSHNQHQLCDIKQDSITTIYSSANICSHRNINHQLLQHLSASPIDIEELVLLMNIPLTDIYTAITELELEGRVIRYAGGAVSIRY